MLTRLLRLALVLVCLCPAGLPLPAAPPAAAEETDWAAVIGAFPAEGSPEAAEELAILLWLQRTRGPAEVARAAKEVDVSPAWFKEVLPIGNRPRTMALLEQARQDAWTRTGGLKQRFHRVRPFLANPELTPAVYRDTSYSFPSGHATLGILYARLLGALVPGRREAVLERGLQVGFDRVLAGVHWPTDVLAGQKLGEALADQWLADPEHQRLVRETRIAEWN